MFTYLESLQNFERGAHTIDSYLLNLDYVQKILYLKFINLHRHISVLFIEICNFEVF